MHAQMAKEAESAVNVAQAGIEQANEAVTQAQSDVDSAQADMTYWTAEIAREQKLFAQGAIAREELERETAQSDRRTGEIDADESGGAYRAGRRDTRQGRICAGASTGRRPRRPPSPPRKHASNKPRRIATAREQKITEAQAGVQTALADVRAAEAGVTVRRKKRGGD